MEGTTRLTCVRWRSRGVSDCGMVQGRACHILHLKVCVRPTLSSPFRLPVHLARIFIASRSRASSPSAGRLKALPGHCS